MEIEERYFTTPNIIFEIKNVLSSTLEVTRKFYFLRTFWKFEIENESENTSVSMLVHKSPVNYPIFTFTVISGWLKHNNYSLFEKTTVRIYTEQLMTEKKGRLLIWENDLRPYLSMFPDSTPTFVCSIKLHDEFDNIPDLFEERIPLVTPSSLSSLTGDLKSLLDASTMTDVVLKCGNKSIPVHKCILSCRSPVFRAMFQESKESAQETIKIDDMESKMFEKFVYYIYTGNIDLCEEGIQSVRDLLKVADKFCLQSLKERCYDYLVDILEPSNACDVLVMTHLNGYTELKAYVLSYIASKRDFLLSANWQKFAKEHEVLALNVLSQYVEISKLK